MNISALITMTATWAVVIAFAGYFFLIILKGNKPDKPVDQKTDEA